jgi:hypothetical protein
MFIMIDNYKIYKFDYIKENQAEIICESSICHDSLISDGFQDTTWSYLFYNIFSVSSPSIHYWNIFKYLKNIIKENIDEERVWLQSWLNYHSYDDVLDWHNHSCDNLTKIVTTLFLHQYFL